MANQNRPAQVEALLEAAKIAWLTNSNHEKMSFEECNTLLATIQQVQAMKDKLVFIPEEAQTAWDDVEIQPVSEDEQGNCDVCNEGEETFWSVYLHQVEGGVKCIADLPTKALAEQLAALITNAVKSHK
jgi:hypothetical protein